MAVSISDASGTMSHGEAITITGSGFGTKATATPFLYDDFENATNGSNVDGRTPTHGDTWGAGSQGGTAHAPTITTTNVRHAHGTKCALLDDDPAEGNYAIALFAGGGFGNGEKLYYKFWTRMSKNGNYCGNYKPIMIFNSDYSQETYIGYGLGGDGVRTDAVMCSPSIFGSQTQPDVLDTWVAYEEEISIQTSGGTRKGWIHTPSDILLEWEDQTMTRTLVSGSTYNEFWFGCYHDTELFNYIFRIGEVYVDTTFQRAILGDAATLATCNKQELLVPSAWSNTSITATLRLGAFGDTGTAYLYVADSTGAVNADGFEITLGGTGGGQNMVMGQKGGIRPMRMSGLLR